MSTTSTGPVTTTWSRLRGLTKANWQLMLRNRLTLMYGLLLPLLPLLLLFTGDRGNQTAGATVATLVVFLLVVFPVFYNLLSMFVSRRDELVLKRLRTGEARDSELVASMALPGVLITLGVSVVLVGLGMALGQPFPLNPVLMLGAVLLGAAVFVALALWTAAWTRTAEAAQLTSMPVVILAGVGQMTPALPESWRSYVELTPGSALDTLVRLSWFGIDGDDHVDFAASWVAAAPPLGVLVGWIVIGWVLASRSMHWEPRH